MTHFLDSVVAHEAALKAEVLRNAKQLMDRARELGLIRGPATEFAPAKEPKIDRKAVCPGCNREVFLRETLDGWSFKMHRVKVGSNGYGCGPVCEMSGKKAE